MAVVRDGAFAEHAVRHVHELLLYLRGADVLAVAEDDQLLAAARQEEEAVFVDVAQVARMEPSVRRQRLRRLLRLVVVAFHDVLPADHHFAVHDSHFVAGDGLAGGAGLVAAGRREGDHRRGFRHAVAFKQLETKGVVVARDLRVVRGAAG